MNIEPIKLLQGSHAETGKTGMGCFMNVIAYLEIRHIRCPRSVQRLGFRQSLYGHSQKLDFRCSVFTVELSFA